VWGLQERDKWLEAGRNCLLGRYEASGGGGVWRSRLAKEGGLNEEEDNWIRLQGRSQRGGVGGYYLILDIGV
jgi:hypothetical protein